MICPECSSEFVDTTTRYTCLTCGWQASPDIPEHQTTKASLRGTGRTTRMLEEAIDMALCGQNVFVVVVSYQQAKDLLNQIIAKVGEQYLAKTFRGVQGGARFTTGGRITFLKQDNPNILWKTFSIVGMGLTETVIVDHHVIETRFRKILEMLHRWDPKTEENPQ